MANWSIPKHIKGDTFNQRKITFPFDITDCVIKMQFRVTSVSNIVLEFTTENNTFEKISSTEVLMKSRILNVSASNYIADLEVTFLDGTVYTYFTANLQIIQDITR